MSIEEVESRPSWDDYFMALAFVVSQKSLDPSTKHGCVVVDDDKIILSVGYNSPPRGCQDSLIPLDRPHKYSFFIHAEANSIVSAARSGVSLKNSTFYITGHPCPRCFGEIKNVGAKKIIYGPIASACVSEEEMRDIEIMNIRERGNVSTFSLNSYEIAIIKYEGNIRSVLQTTLKYFDQKVKKQV